MLEHKEYDVLEIIVSERLKDSTIGTYLRLGFWNNCDALVARARRPMAWILLEIIHTIILLVIN